MSSGGAFDWKRAPLGPGVKLLRSHPAGLAALEKPAGVLSHPNRAQERTRSLLRASYDSEQECFKCSDDAEAAWQVWLLHRLDSATSGVVLVATNRAMADAVRAAFAERAVNKAYIAVVLGHPRERRALWRDSLQVTRADGVARAQDSRGSAGMQAETAMRCIRLIPGPPALAALELQPHTGRTHQLRHQCARRHLPILGDQNYGNFRQNRELARQLGTERLFLHAQSIALTLQTADGRVQFSAESPLPLEFRRFVRGR